MKKIVFFLMLGFMSVFFTRCDLNKDGYSLDNVWVGFGLVQKDSVAQTYQINLDDGSVLFPATSYPDFADRIENNERVIANFTILSDKANNDNQEQYYVRVNSLQKILFKGILNITPELEDSIGNDPIHVRHVWMKNNMLNFELKYKGGSKIHYINLVKQPGPINTENGPVVLELRHNKNGDTESFPLSAIVTFKLDSLKVSGMDSTQFKVTAKDYDGTDFEYSGTYKY